MFLVQATGWIVAALTQLRNIERPVSFGGENGIKNSALHLVSLQFPSDI